MKTSIATVSLSGDLVEKLDAISKAGFDAIEIFEQDFIGSSLSPADVRQLVADYGLEIALFQPFRDFEGLPAGKLRDRAFSRAKYKFELMQELGTDLILICSSTHAEALGGIDRAADDFAALGEIAKSFDVRVGFEALAWGRYISDHRDAWEVVRRANHDHIGLILDSYHTLIRNIDTRSICSIPSDKIFFVQLADAPAIDMDYLYLSRHFRNMPGEGDLPVGRFMDAVCQTGYAGTISLEIFNDQFRRTKSGLVAKDGHRSLLYLVDRIAARKSDDNMPSLPQPVRISDVRYIEFTVEAETLPMMVETFGQLGFVVMGRHKSKHVIWLQQGQVNLLLNADADRHAAESGSNTALMVSEIGLDVEDAQAALERAVGLGAIDQGSQQANETDILPRIEGIGSSLIAFTDSDMDIWKRDFQIEVSSSQEAGKDAPDIVTKIDHIAQTMRYDEMLSWSLFYTAIFDMQKSPLVDVIDPDGVIKSQILQTPDAQVQFTLNGSDALHTRATSFVTENPGATVQHIAFATDDAVRAATTLLARHVDILPQTENYYADLQARFGLTDAFLAKLQAANIMYDEDEAGAFLQFYYQPEKSGMFFEFVERQNGYGGFGAANAPYRLAAQRRQSSQMP